MVVVWQELSKLYTVVVKEKSMSNLSSSWCLKEIKRCGIWLWLPAVLIA